MAKYTAEFDTEAKTCTLYYEGQAIDLYDFSISRYKTINCETGQPEQWSYLSFCKEIGENERVSYSYSFKDGGDMEYAETAGKADFLRKVGEIHQRDLVISSLAKALVSQKS